MDLGTVIGVLVAVALVGFFVLKWKKSNDTTGNTGYGGSSYKPEDKLNKN